MNQLYSITDRAFHAWLMDNPSEDDLREARAVLLAKKGHLFTPGHHDSFYHDRFDRDHKYATHINAIDEILESMVD